MPTSEQQPLGGVDRRPGVGQPGVPAVHPPQQPEDQQHLRDAGQRQVAGQQRGELGQGEGEDQVEEQLERRDPQRLVAGPPAR